MGVVPKPKHRSFERGQECESDAGMWDQI